jgi:hypothetical protein
MRSTTLGNDPARRWRLAIAFLGAMAMAACDELTSPTSSDPFAGSWAGAIADRASGSGTLRMALSGDPYLSGTWSATIAGQSPTGPATVTPPVGVGRALTLTCGSGPARGVVAVVATVDGSILQGDYYALECPGLLTGSLELRRQ